MHHLNFCRQMVQQFTINLQNPKLDIEMRLYLKLIILLAGKAQKFILPDGGRLVDDKDLRGLDESEQLHLPFELIALEYLRPVNEMEQGEVPSSKSIVFAEQKEDLIAITQIAWNDLYKMWAPYPQIAIPRTGYLDRSVRSPEGRPAIRFKKSLATVDANIPSSDYQDELGALLCFLNILNCSNVHIDVSHPKHRSRKVKAALPFDSYHMLTISRPSGGGGLHQGGTHRSPREHLRRGHIRRLDKGRIWVNSTIVAAGSAGTVRKDYALN